MKHTSTIAIAALAALSTTTLAEPETNTANKWTEAELRADLPKFELPKVWFGTDAPEMKIAEWVKGAPVTEFEPGQAYVVEFWATWCLPCVKAFPHLSEIKAHYGDKVRIVGVNIWDQPDKEDQTARNARVSKFVAKKGDDMAYTVAVEDGSAMADGWMIAAAQNGIPTAFIVDQKGKVAWIGYPMQLDSALEQVVNGKYDFSNEAKAKTKDLIKNQKMMYLRDLLSSEDPAKGFATFSILIDKELANDPGSLNSYAWSIANSYKIQNKDFNVLAKAAKRACKLTNWNEPGILDTLGFIYAKMGKLDKAIEVQTKAVNLAKGKLKTDLTNRLEEFKQLKADQS